MSVDWYSAFQRRMRVRVLGDSNTEGFGANQEAAGGFRPWLVKDLESWHGDVQVMGIKGYGDTKFGPSTGGSFATRFSWWENDGFGGEQIGYELSVVQPTHGTTFTSNGLHWLGVGNLWRWLNKPPPPFNTNEAYMVESVPTPTTFRLKSTYNGAAIAATGWGSAPFSGVTGLRALPPLLAAGEGNDTANVIIVASLGTNDINNEVNRGASASAASDTAASRMSSMLTELAAAWPQEDTLIVVGGAPPFFNGSVSGGTWETKQQAVALYRSKIAADIAQRGDRFIYKNIWEVTEADGNGDGIHGRNSFYRPPARILSDVIREKTRGATSGRVFPRATTKIARRPKLLLNTTTGRVTGPTTSIGSSTFLVAFSYRPETGNLPADGTTRFMAWLGTSDYNTGFGIASRNTTGVAGRAGLGVYIMGALVQTAASGPGYNFDSGGQDMRVLREGEWTDWVILFNAETMLCTTFRDGERLNTTSIASAWNIIDNPWRIGHISTGLPASQGLYQDFEIAKGSHLTVAAAMEYARGRLTSRARIPGVVDHRPLNEGTGTSAASTIYQQAAAALSGSATWADADTAVPPWES